MIWPAQLLLARASGSTSAALGTAKFLDNWRLGQTVRPSTVFNNHVYCLLRCPHCNDALYMRTDQQDSSLLLSLDKLVPLQCLD